jgi:Pro-kumamolisin, activation domain/Bacterial Ig-like domain (group 3)
MLPRPLTRYRYSAIGILSFFWLYPHAIAQLPQSFVQQLPAPQALIVGEIDEAKQTVLHGNTLPLANAANDRGSVPQDQPLDRMLLLLRRSPQQDDVLDKMLAAQQEPGSDLYHRWLTPQQFGRWFGASDHDVQTISGWLGSHGFSNLKVSQGHTVIEFSGTAGQVAAAFHTSMHYYLARGALHIANQRDPSIPTALSPAIVGIVSLNNFGRRSMVVPGPVGIQQKGQAHPHISREAQPQYTIPDPTTYTTYYWLAPYDFAAIYDLVPLWNQGLDGTGQTIAIVGQTDIHTTDIDQFRTLFGLPANTTTVITSGPDPGFLSDELEADLDVEWSGAVAKGANVDLVTSASTETTAGVDLSALYIVDNNLAPIMSESYGDCELFLGTAGNAFELSLWKQASSEGITVLVSSGDQGSTACDPTDANQDLATHPMAVNGLASTPYNVAVGGTDFNQYEQWSQYWSSSNDPTTKQSVFGYIPEVPWNDSCGSTILDTLEQNDPTTACNSGTVGVSNRNTIATSGGPSSCISSDGTDSSSCTVGYAKPMWQTGTGVPQDGVRDIPDVSLFAGNNLYNSAYVVCDADYTNNSGCDPTASTQSYVGVGGTSAGAPAMAGLMAIINQKYGRQGNANVTLYRLASSASGSTIFHDVSTDGNRVACSSQSPDCEIPAGSSNPVGRTKGHDSTVGYDMVTGLGSIDAANLVNNWSSASFTPTNTTLSLDGGVGVVSATHGSSIDAIVNVSAATGDPTGDVSLSGATRNGSIFLGTLNAGSVSNAVNSLPGGSYSVTARYAGDTQFAPSDSGPVTVNISPEPSATKLSILNYDPLTGSITPASVVPYGSLLILRSDVTGQSGHGYPTGLISLTDGGTSLGQFALNAQGNNEDISTNLLLGGIHAISSSYSGDSSFGPSSVTSSVSVTPTPMLCNLVLNTTVLRPGWVLVLTGFAQLYQTTLTPPFGVMVAPTGTMSIDSGTTPFVGPTAVVGSGTGGTTNSSGAFNLPYAELPQLTLQLSQIPSFTSPVSLGYSGDSNYASCASSPIQLSYDTAPVPTQLSFGLSAYQNILAGTPITLTAKIIAANLPPSYEPSYPTPTGTVQVSIDNVNVGSPAAVVAGPLSGFELTGAATVSIPTGSLTSGMHTVALAYSGDSNYSAASVGETYIWVVRPDFSITATPNSLSATNGQSSGPASIQVAAADGFTGSIAFSCSNLPAGATCVFSPPTVTTSGTTSLTITTTKAESIGSGTLALDRALSREWLKDEGGVSFALLFLLVVPRKRRKSLFIVLIASLTIFLGTTSCGGSSNGTGGGSGAYETATTLTAATTTPSKGASDTFTAQVFRSGGAASEVTGSVQFAVDGADTGSPVSVGNNGIAQSPLTFSTAGKHSVIASYSGDGSDQSSSSSALSINVPYTSGTVPGNYTVTVTASSGTLTHSVNLTLVVD